jgi:hypothetical protein
VHSQRRSETSPLRSRFQVRRASLSASGLDRIHSRVVRLRSADGGPGSTTLEAARYAPPRLGNAIAGTSAIVPSSDRTDRRPRWMGRPHLLQPARLWEDVSSGHMA